MRLTPMLRLHALLGTCDAALTVGRHYAVAGMSPAAVRRSMMMGHRGPGMSGMGGWLVKTRDSLSTRSPWRMTKPS